MRCEDAEIPYLKFKLEDLEAAGKLAEKFEKDFPKEEYVYVIMLDYYDDEVPESSSEVIGVYKNKTEACKRILKEEYCKT